MDPGLERPKTPDYLKPDLVFQLQPETSVVLTSDLHLFSNPDVLVPDSRGRGERGGGISGVRHTSNRTLDRIRHPNIISRDLIAYIRKVLTGPVFPAPVWELRSR